MVIGGLSDDGRPGAFCYGGPVPTALSGSTAIDRRPAAPQTQPFFNRRSTLVFSAVGAAGLVGFVVVYGLSGSGSGTLGWLAAVLEGVAVVAGAVGWVGGLMLALRSGSFLWLLLVVLFPLLGPAMVALWSQPAPPPRGGRP